MLNVGERIKVRRIKMGWTQDELAEKTGYKSRSSINKIEKGGNDLPQSKIVLFAKVLKTTPSYLLGWEDDTETLIDKYNSIGSEILKKHNGDLDAAYKEQQLIDEQESRKAAHAIVNTHNINENPLKDDLSNISAVISPDNIYKIPIFESVSAGFGSYASDCIVDYLPMVIDNPHDVEDTIAIKVKGDSMYPKIEDGDIIVVRKQESVDSGDVAVMLLDGEEGLVKKVIYGETWIELHSFNPEYKTRHFDDAEVERLRVVGKVLKVVKTL